MDPLRAQLLVIMGAAPRGHLLHWRVGGSGRFANRFHPIGGFEDVPEQIRADDRRHETVYLACAPRTGRDGGRAGVGRVQCLWADCDSDDALEALVAFPLSPTLLIASGGVTPGGRDKLHVYWRLAMSVERDAGHAALRALQKRLGSDSKCAEPARVLRPATTTWRKDGASREVELRRVELDAAYPIDAILQAAGTVRTAGAGAGAGAGGAVAARRQEAPDARPAPP